MLVSSEVSGLRLRQEVFGQAEDLTDVDVVDDVDVGVVHVHVVHGVGSGHAAESIKGTSATDKQERGNVTSDRVNQKKISTFFQRWGMLV